MVTKVSFRTRAETRFWPSAWEPRSSTIVLFLSVLSFHNLEISKQQNPYDFNPGCSIAYATFEHPFSSLITLCPEFQPLKIDLANKIPPCMKGGGFFPCQLWFLLYKTRLTCYPPLRFPQLCSTNCELRAFLLWKVAWLCLGSTPCVSNSLSNPSLNSEHLLQGNRDSVLCNWEAVSSIH